MNPNEINRRIAIACRWSNFEKLLHLTIGTSPKGRRYLLVPNYHGDLNAMHEAEKVLTQEQCVKYFALLATMTFQNPRVAVEHWQAHATAAQRAEAFLRTIGQWEEDDK